MAAIQLAVYPSVSASAEAMQEMVDKWPEALREAFSLDAYATGSGFLNAELFSMMLPLVLVALAVGGAAAATAGEEERGTVDLLLALPVARWLVLTGKAAAMTVTVFAVAAVSFVVVAVGAGLVDLDVATAGIAAVVFMTALLALVFGGVGLLVGAATGRRAFALGTGIGLALAAFLLNALAPLAEWLEPWQKVSPFYWALNGNPVVNGVDWPFAALMSAFAVGPYLLAIEAYRRRDLRSR